MRKLLTFAVVIPALLMTQHAGQYALGQGLTGEHRTTFVANSIRGCFDKQRADPLNESLPDIFIRDYCRCFANSMADTFSDDQFILVLRGGSIPPRMQEQINILGNACIASTSKQYFGR
jgi:hypothetical protein